MRLLAVGVSVYTTLALAAPSANAVVARATEDDITDPQERIDANTNAPQGVNSAQMGLPLLLTGLRAKNKDKDAGGKGKESKWPRPWPWRGSRDDDDNDNDSDNDEDDDRPKWPKWPSSKSGTPKTAPKLPKANPGPSPKSNPSPSKSTPTSNPPSPPKSNPSPPKTAPKDSAGGQTSVGTTPKTPAAVGAKRISLWEPEVAAPFQIILTGAVDTASKLAPDFVNIFDIDMFNTPKSTIVELQKQDKKVICYFSAGSSEDWRDDYTRIKKEDMGKAVSKNDAGTSFWEGEKWLNIKNANPTDTKNLPNVWQLMRDRIRFAAEQGCDAIDPDNVDGYENDNGLGLTKQDSINFIKFMSDEARQYNMATGLKNSMEILPNVDRYVQFAVNEQCAEMSECGKYKDFLEKKPVFHIEYTKIKTLAGVNPQRESSKGMGAQRSPADLAPLSKFCSFRSAPNWGPKFSTVIKVEALDGWVQFCDGRTVTTRVVGSKNQKPAKATGNSKVKEDDDEEENKIETQERLKEEAEEAAEEAKEEAKERAEEEKDEKEDEDDDDSDDDNDDKDDRRARWDRWRKGKGGKRRGKKGKDNTSPTLPKSPKSPSTSSASKPNPAPLPKSNPPSPLKDSKSVTSSAVKSPTSLPVVKTTITSSPKDSKSVTSSAVKSPTSLPVVKTTTTSSPKDSKSVTSSAVKSSVTSAIAKVTTTSSTVPPESTTPPPPKQNPKPAVLLPATLNANGSASKPPVVGTAPRRIRRSWN